MKRLKYSQLRFVAALSTGGCAMVISWCVMWMISTLAIEDVIFISLFVYLIVGGAIGLLTEPKKQQAEKPVEKPRQFCMYDMTRRRWDVHTR